MFLLLTLGCGARPVPPESAAQPAPAAAAAPREVQEVWDGEVALPGAPLHFTATLTPATEGWSGLIDIPMQGAKGLALQAISTDVGAVRFTLQPPGAPESASAVFSGTRSDAAVTGTLQQAGQEFHLSMRLLASGESPAAAERPQTPQPPFPYLAAEVSYPSGAITVAGTLTLPQGQGPWPAALLITGSGAQDRDETILEHKPFAVIADRLSRAGVAVLRVDDRGVGGTGGSTAAATHALLVGDIQAGVRFLRGREDIDPARVGLIGHSEGGMTGPMAAAEDPSIAFVVMLAGPGIPSREILLSQARTAYEDAGASGDQLAALVALHAAALEAPASDPEALEVAVRALVEAQLQLAGAPPSEEALAAGLAQFRSPWFQSFLPLDPADYLGRVRCPVLALGGSLDSQVPTDTNLPAIRAALAENPDATVEELAGLNHLFQTADTGKLDEYAVLTETFAPAALDRLTQWVVSHTASAG